MVTRKINDDITLAYLLKKNRNDDFTLAVGQVTLPAGTSSAPSQTTVDLSSEIPSGYDFVSCQLGAYVLPYITNSTGQVATWIGSYNSDTRSLLFLNRASAWSNYTYRVLFRRA